MDTSNGGGKWYLGDEHQSYSDMWLVSGRCNYDKIPSTVAQHGNRMVSPQAINFVIVIPAPSYHQLKKEETKLFTSEGRSRQRQEMVSLLHKCNLQRNMYHTIYYQMKKQP